MTQSINIVDPAGARRVDPEQLPLTIGTSSAADIKVAGPVAPGACALIDVLDQRPFIQPSGDSSAGSPAVAVNGATITSTRWLEAGDVISVAGTSIGCEINADLLQFSVSSETLEYATAPPVLESAAGDPGAETAPISPVRRASAAAKRPAAKGRSRAWAFGYGAFAVLALTAFYLFTAKAVLIQVEPGEAEVRIAGGLLKLEVDGRYLLRPGDYRVMLTAQGYETSREEITVGDADSQDFSFAMRRLPGRLTVRVPDGVDARLQIDERDEGLLTGEEIKVEAGLHSIRISADRYLDFDGEIEIEGRDQPQLLEAQLVPNWSDVTVTTRPAGATVYSGEEALGETPVTIQLMAGVGELTVRKDGFKPWRKTLTAVPNQPQVLPEIELVEADSLLTVTSVPAGAAVTIDGRYRGTTPVDAELAPGAAYQVIISKPGFGTTSRSVTMESTRGKTLRVELEARVGVITVIVDPPDAELFIDGQSRGVSGQTLSLPAKPHRIEVRRDGFEPYRGQFTPKPGLPEKLEIKLLTPEQAILAATPRIITNSQGLDLLLVGPGELVMGAPRREQGRRPNETQHQVRLTRSFYIGTREITNSQFREYNPKHTSGSEKYRQLAAGEHPAVMMSWEDATGYCNWLSNRESLPAAYVWEEGEIVLASPPTIGYRLPTEAEWAWAARYNGGGGEQKYPWGNRMPPARNSGNYADLSSRSILANVISDYSDGFPITSPAGIFPPSPIGLFDIGGNVAEWVNDYYGVATDTSGVEVDPVGPTEGQYHVIRGSGWRHASIGELRFAYRDFGSRGRMDVGFRVARFTEEAQ